MLINFLKLIAGIIILYIGAEGMVRGSKRFAASLGIHPLVVGLTIVAFGTSMPELVVSLTAAFRGAPAIALGNAVGSNIANLGLILGVAALISPMKVEDRTVRLEVPITIFAGILLFLFAGNLEISAFEGVLLLLGFVTFFFVAVFPQISKNWRVLPEELDLDLENPLTQEEINELKASRTWGTNLLLVVLGIAGLVLGADFTVNSATQIALDFGISEMVIGASVVALGTSLPELATSIVAALNDEPDISVGNVIGSNLFNTLIVIGTSAVATGYLPLEKDVLVYDFPVMIGLSILVLPLLRSHGKLDRSEGLGLVAVYIGYILLILIRPQFLVLPNLF
ncbi:sodium:calcium antiporter [bacterium]|nr:MAG: sodium:calcium antiporter [bacterium]